MNEISLPYHLIIPSLISILILGTIILKRKKLFANRKWKSFWISTIIFFGIYLLIVGGATYADISSEMALRKFDLNGDGMFNGAEITPELKVALNKVSSDTGRNFSFITRLIFSGIITFFIFLIGKATERMKTENKKTTHNTV
ncbi:hypothetical protein [Tenacibaculum soleae]|uniref:hypothetical protein n=1 Tax=Tenacibaculum soleae TaxID=447689 RepID=UPI0026E473D8|nr:hypothetical protein [Tenacibaculum soleae]MDO6814009.1 hypothetical protein [Tenacibaculum soleae]